MVLKKIDYMDLKSAIDIILRDLKEAGDLIDDLKNKPEYPELQIEMVRAKCRSAEDLIRLVGEIISQTAGRGLIVEEEKEGRESDADHPVSVSTGDVPELEDSEPENEIREREEIKEEVSNTESHEEKPEIRTEKIVADRFAHLSSRINEKVGDSKKAEGKTRTMPVTDLHKALGINDRFFFIKELFGGREESFRQTINSLNSASTMDEATGILKETLRDKADSEPASQLLELVHRKLSGK